MIFQAIFWVALAAAPNLVRAQENEGSTEKAPEPPAAPAATDAGKDFVAGDRVIFAADFARDQIGNFPRALELKSGNMEVATVGGKRFLRATSHGEFVIALPEILPQRFTMEFDLAGSGGWYQELYFAADEDPYFLTLRPNEDGGIAGPDEFRVIAAPEAQLGEGAPVRIQVMADGSYVKVYMNGTRIANAPNAKIGRSRQVRFKLMADQDTPALIGNVRIAAGGKGLYQALSEEGRVTAEGILFDTDSDRLRPESAAILKEIGEVLTAHADLRLGIEGHTDNTGTGTANEALSRKRAAAVLQWLVTNSKVDTKRLEAKGFGSSKPAASNETPEGRQTNRRVELIRL